MSGYYRDSSYYYRNSPNQSFDPFSSPHTGQRGYSNQQSVDVFAITPKRRSHGENGTISRAIGNALDPEYGYSEPSIDVFGPSTSSHVDYDDDASILAAVSSAHSSQGSTSGPSSQEQSLNQNSISDLFQNSQQKFKSKKEAKDKYAAIFNKTLKPDDEDSTMQDFMSPDQIVRHRKLHKQRPKQIRMDDYVFKARRVDKGAREFGLHTTHEPKRGSKKKRDSIEQLEVEKIEFDRQKQKKQENVMENRKNEVENLDFSLAFGTPSPVRNKPKTSKLTQFFDKDTSRNITPLKKVAKDSHPNKSLQNQKSSITFNDPSIYSNDSFLEATVCSTPDKSQLAETIPLESPSPARKQQTTPRRNVILENYYRRQPVSLVKPNPIKRKEFENPNRQPLSQPKKQKIFSNKKVPEFDYPSSPITLNDDDDDEDDLKTEMKPSKRQTLRDEEEKRKTFAAHVTEREQMVRQLVDQKFKEERENGGIETRKAELKDGQVIRNKEMRKNLMHGAACQCCRGYYDRLGMEEHEKKDYINKISRHRYVHQALPDTPEHYWDLTMGPCEKKEKQMTQTRNWEASIKNRKSEERTGIHNWN